MRWLLEMVPFAKGTLKSTLVSMSSVWIVHDTITTRSWLIVHAFTWSARACPVSQRQTPTALMRETCFYSSSFRFLWPLVLCRRPNTKSALSANGSGFNNIYTASQDVSIGDLPTRKCLVYNKHWAESSIILYEKMLIICYYYCGGGVYLFVEFRCKDCLYRIKVWGWYSAF